jgi:hypothetical protein
MKVVAPRQVGCALTLGKFQILSESIEVPSASYSRLYVLH